MDYRLLAHFNWYILLLTLALDAIGLVNLYSAVQQEGQPGLPAAFFSQLVFVGVGIVAMIAMTILDYRIYERLAYALYAGGLVLLAIPLLTGRVISGARRWIDVGPFSVQPSEFGKLLLIIVLAKYFHAHVMVGGYRLRDLVRPALLIAPMVGLIYLSPDLGTAAFYAMLFLLVAFAVNLRWRSILALLVAVVGLLPVAYTFVLSDYQRNRVLALLDPTGDPLGKGYQILQARYAIGAGRLMGNGYLNGVQTHQGFIPENHTDFVVTVLAEEWGFLGCVVVLALFFVLLALGLRVAAQAKERFGAILATGIVCALFLQLVVNLGGVLGLLPVTGVTLPLMSYGGSSILTVHLMIGLLLNISMRRYMF